MPASNEGNLGTQLVGNKIAISEKNLLVSKLIGEGGFSFVYLVKEVLDGNDQQNIGPRRNLGSTKTAADGSPLYVMKVTAIHSKSQKSIAEKEAKLLSRCTHPCIIRVFGACFSTISHFNPSGRRGKDSASSGSKEKPQHFILMEYCEGGHALDVCQRLVSQGKRFDRSELIVAFGQICNAVSYLHSQTPPIVHRDLKPANFLVTNGTYKLCDFGSAVIGHVDLRTPKDRAYAEDIIQKTTTQMFRSPEMVDLYMAKKLTQATDVWALGCSLYQMAFFQNCFEEGSNLAILSGNYAIPDDNPYGADFAEVIDRMLQIDYKNRADMREVILCLSSLYAGRPLKPRERRSRSSRSDGNSGNNDDDAKEKKKERVGTFRTDGQGVQEAIYDPTKKTEAKKLNSNSVAARRKRAAQQNAKPPPAPNTGTARASTATNASTASDPIGFGSFHSDFSNDKNSDTGQGDPFGSSAFADMKGFDSKAGSDSPGFFGTFENADTVEENANHAFDAAFDTGAWGDDAVRPDDGQFKPSAAQSGNGYGAKAELTGEQRALAILRKGQSQQVASDTHRIPSTSQSSSGSGNADSFGRSHDGKDASESQRRERSRRSRGHGQHDGRTDVDRRMEGLSLNGGFADERPVQHPTESWENADRRVGDEHRTHRTTADDDDKRRRSGSRSRRKARATRDSGRPTTR